MEFELLELEIDEKIIEVHDWFSKQLTRITISGANPEMFKNLKIDYFDSLTPIIDLCSITKSEAQQLIIKPYEKNLTPQIIKIIEKQNYSISIQDEGDKIRIIFPTLTKERRNEEVKKISKIKEEGKIKVRNIRQHYMKIIKSEKDLSEDFSSKLQEKVQKIVDKNIKIIDETSNKKEQELLNN